jgi:hypothetical protein
MRCVSYAQKQIVGRRPACVLAVRGLGERPLEVPGPRAETRDGTARADEASRDLRSRPGPETRRPARSAPPSTRGSAERDIGSARNPSAPLLKREAAKPSPRNSSVRRQASLVSHGRAVWENRREKTW